MPVPKNTPSKTRLDGLDKVKWTGSPDNKPSDRVLFVSNLGSIISVAAFWHPGPMKRFEKAKDFKVLAAIGARFLIRAEGRWLIADPKKIGWLSHMSIQSDQAAVGYAVAKYRKATNVRIASDIFPDLKFSLD